MGDYRLRKDERSRLLGPGFLLREDVFSADEISVIGTECKTLVARLSRRKGEWITFGSCTFDAEVVNDTIITREGNSDIVQRYRAFCASLAQLERLKSGPAGAVISFGPLLVHQPFA